MFYSNPSSYHAISENSILAGTQWRAHSSLHFDNSLRNICTHRCVSCLHVSIDVVFYPVKGEIKPLDTRMAPRKVLAGA